MPLCVCPQAPELDEPSNDPGATGSYPRAETPPRASTPTRPLAFTTPPGSAGGDPHRLSGVFVVGGGGKARESSEPVELFASDCLGADRLSQDSQLSASTLSLSQELSQGSLVDPGVGETAAPTSTPPPSAQDGAKPKKKGSKKAKKKKVRPKSKESSPRPASSACSSAAAANAAAGATDAAQGADGVEGSSLGETAAREHRSSSGRCGKSSKSEKADKKSRTLSRRPEPEGGNSSQPSFSANEYERIINGNEPLFSDLDLSGDDEAKPPPPPRPYRQSRLRAAAAAAAGGGGGGVGGMVGIFIPCTQLGINSNTMIKFAIIGTELQNIFQVSNRVSKRKKKRKKVL